MLSLNDTIRQTSRKLSQETVYFNNFTMPLHGGLVLLLLLLTATSLVNSTLLFDQEGSGGFSSGDDIEGSGYSSGDGDIVVPEPPGDECSNAATTAVTDAPFSPVDEGDAVLEARCRSYCLEKVRTECIKYNTTLTQCIMVAAY